MNFKIAPAINLFCVLQFRSHKSLDRFRHVFFRRLYGCLLAFCPAEQGPGCFLVASWQGSGYQHMQWSVAQVHAVFLWFVHMKDCGQDGLWTKRTVFTPRARTGFQLQTGSKNGRGLDGWMTRNKPESHAWTPYKTILILGDFSSFWWSWSLFRKI